MYIKADWNDADYVKVGNLMLPTNTADFGNMSAEQISDRTKREYENELARREEEARIQAEAEKGLANYEKAFEVVDPAQKPSDQLSAIADVLVPPSGMCDNLGAELVRAINRILYRDWNDGDVFYEGYGLETCSSSAAFIADYADDKVRNALFDAIGLEGDEYTNAIENVGGLILDYLREHPELFGRDTEDSRDYSSTTIDEIEEAAPEYEFDFDARDVTPYVDRGCIDWSDFEEWIEGLSVLDYSDAKVDQNWEGSYTISDISRDQYNQLTEEFWDWLERYVDELRETYTDGDYWQFYTNSEWAKFLAPAFGGSGDWESIQDLLDSGEYARVLDDIDGYSYSFDDSDDVIAAFKDHFEIEDEDESDEDEEDEDFDEESEDEESEE